jgi:hypothetical protein
MLSTPLKIEPKTNSTSEISANAERSYVKKELVKLITSLTDRFPELSYPFTVTALAALFPTMIALTIEKTPLANSMDAVVDVRETSRGDTGERPAYQLLQIKPSYVVRTSPPAKSSKSIVPILTKVSELPEEDFPFDDLSVGDLFDLVVGALDESLDPLEKLGLLVFLLTLGPLEDFRVGDLELLLPFKSLAMTLAQIRAKRRNIVLREFIVAG